MSIPSDRRIGTLAALGAFAAVESLQGFGVSMLTPQIAATLTVTAVSLLSVRVPAIAVDLVLPLAVPSLTDRRRALARAWTTRVGALAAALALLLTGQARGSWALIGVLCLGSLVGAPGRVLQRSTALNETGEGWRIRALSSAQLGALSAQIVLPVVIIVTATTWHRGLAGVALAGFAVVVVASVAPRPREAHAPALPPADEVPRWSELGRSWRATPSLLGAGVALTAVGCLLLPYDAVLSIYLRQHFHLGPRGISGVFLAIGCAGVVLVLVTSTHADRLLSARPARLATLSSFALATASVLLLVAPLVPSRTAMVVLVAFGAALANLLVPVLLGLGLTVTLPAQRTAVASATASSLALGGLLGLVVAVCVADRYGVRYALVSLAGVGVLASGWWGRATSHLEIDRQRADELLERAVRDAEARPEGAARSGGPLLVCRGIDFAYGSLQVLFDVDAHVDEGEIVGLLGTNGAGKSTLLRVICGLGIPQRGSVTFAGRDITYLDAEARVRDGITQVPGGKAVFRSMNVVENLQSYGYTLGRDRRAVDEAIERCFDAFPRLRERRSSTAAMLSGGEQQMVALSKALILRPRVLLIDELSLGLAPVIVNRLLDMVRRINEEGTAVVIVEQSVTTALSLVDRAYFMEKGEVRFDGPATDLIDRHDLLRAVFLEGAAKGVLT
ncbi:MAG TPA: ATP-binding protein [Mycobacteriales bacterium]|nr:ATP-binding protein [Mycobacteriales bacterium]